MKHSFELDNINVNGIDGKVFIEIYDIGGTLQTSFTLGAEQADDFAKALMEQAYAARDFKEPPPDPWWWPAWKLAVRIGRLIK